MPPPVLPLRFLESVLFLSPARRTQEFAIWIDDEAFDHDAHQLAQGGPAHPSRPRLGHKFPSFSDREALRASAHSLFHSIKHSILYLHLQYLSLASTCSSRSVCQSTPNFNTRVSLENFPPQCATSPFSQTSRSRTIDWASAREAMMRKDTQFGYDRVHLLTFTFRSLVSSSASCPAGTPFPSFPGHTPTSILRRTRTQRLCLATAYSRQSRPSMEMHVPQPTHVRSSSPT